MQQNIQALFRDMQDKAPELAQEDAKQRIERLERIENYLEDKDRLTSLFEAMQHDLRKPKVEVIATEVGIVQTQIKYVKKHLRGWLKEKKVSTPLPLIGTSSYIRFEPKGIVLIISPWNFPLNLSLVPLVYAIAAGNSVILKPSEMSSRTSAFIKNMIDELFELNEVVVIEGGADIASYLLDHPFNHIFFTGSPRVGRIVMGKAASNLCSVTLELGGKSPAIVDESADIKKIAKRVAWAKALNCGQTCISPDYLIIHESIKNFFIEEFASSLKSLYGQCYNNENNNYIERSPDYGRIINEHHFQRLNSIYDDAIEKGAMLLYGGNFRRDDLFMGPTLLDNVSLEMEIMQEEIFGPLLPIITYSDRTEINDIISKNPDPLMLYIASSNKDNIRYLLRNNTSGGAVINDYMLGYVNPELPFGGNNRSGIGRSLGFHCFMEFSNKRSIIHRRWGSVDIIYPPYNGRVRKLVSMLYRWM